jgi:enoyl-CoA hydratase/carnithine racemase
MTPDLIIETQGRMGLITLNRPKALNALSLDMIRGLTQALLRWRQDDEIVAVAIRGSSKNGPFGHLCAGGDIRFFHEAALAGDPRLEDFFTEEYALNQLIFKYPKPYIAFMDGVVMGGGMGIVQGATLRVVTETTKMAMPETNIGLFPDVGGGHFLSRCPGHVGEWLGLGGQIIGAGDAVAFGLADVCLPQDQLVPVWAQLPQASEHSADGVLALMRAQAVQDTPAPNAAHLDTINAIYGQASIEAIVSALSAHDSEWASTAAQVLSQRSPLMMHVVLEQIRRARDMSLEDELRMERDMVRHCFHLRPGTASETVEGVRALVIDKDNAPRWNPPAVADVDPDMVQAFFVSPWPAEMHPLKHWL